MKNGISRFEFYLQKVEALMQQAGKEINPALWLYKNDARTPFFMLQALGKLYSKLHNEKRFSKLKDRFKLLEDGIGQIDYYEYYAKLFLDHPGVPVHVREYMQGQAREKTQHVNDILISEGWIGDNNNRIEKIRSKLTDADWLAAEEEAKAIEKYYQEEIEDIKTFVQSVNGNFTDMEAHVHELRRDVRWLSIYPQALLGLVQLTDSGKAAPALGKYLLPEIVNSPYNKMPDKGANSYFLMLHKNHFLAMSWFILELGTLKDEGLQVFAATEALEQTEGLSHDEAYQKAFTILGLTPESMNQLLARASATTKSFMEERILDNVVYGVVNIKKLEKI